MIVGIDIGATKTRIGFKKRGEIIIKEFLTPKNYEGLINLLIENLSKIYFKKVIIGIAGKINIKNGFVFNCPNIGIKNKNLKENLEKKLKKEVIVINDGLAAAVGEKIYGKYPEKNFLYVTISSGIGGGVFVDDKLLFGKDGNAHEIGHINVNFDSKLKCSCGKYGHWEAYCGGNSILKFVKYYSKIRGFNVFNDIKSSEEFFRNYKNYEIGREIFRILQKINAKALASIINLYDPEVVVIGGSVAINNKRIINRKLIKKEVFVRVPKIYFSKVKNNGVLGCLEFDKIYKSYFL